MISVNYVRNCIREHRLMIGFTFLFLGLFQFLIIEILISFNFLDIVAGFVAQLPVQIRQFLGEQFLAQFSLQGAMAFGYTHPLVLTILSLMAIQMPAKRISGEIESGSMEFYMALPFNRLQMGISLIIFSAAVLLVLIAGLMSGTISGMIFYPESRVVPVERFFFIGFNLWFLMLCINGYTMLISAWFNESGKTAMLAAGITLVLYFMNYFIGLSDSLKFLKPASLFDYYDPVKNISDSSGVWIHFAVLGSLAVVFYVLAILKIKYRDIPG